MMYYCLNKSGILDPLLETLYDKYLNTCVVYWGSFTQEKIKQAPFFSDKWLLVISAKDLMLKENKGLLENRFIDIICEVSSEEELNKAKIYCMAYLEEFCLNCNKEVHKLTANWGISRPEFDSLMESFNTHKVLSVYNVNDGYIKSYIKWWLFTREGNQYGDKNSDLNLSIGVRWQKAKEIQLHPIFSLNLDNVAKLVHGNEAQLLTVLNLVGEDILSNDFLMKSSEYFKKPKYLNINNFPLYIFAKQTKKKREILNLIYNYKHNVNLLKKSMLEWCNTFESVYKAYNRGELSVKTKDQWFANEGYELKITTEYRAKLWWYCVNTISLERVILLREKLSSNSFNVYKYIVDICRKEL